MNRLELFHAHRTLVVQLLRSGFSAARQRGWGDDILQAGLEALWRAAGAWDKGAGTPFRAFASTCAWRAMMREEKRQRSIVRVDSLSGNWRRDLPKVVGLGPSVDAGVCEPAAPDTSAWLLRFLERRARELVERSVIHEVPLRDLAAEEGVTHQAIHARRSRAFEALRAALLQEAA